MQRHFLQTVALICSLSTSSLLMAETDTHANPLFDLMSAEFAIQREQYDPALDYYLSQAKHQQSPFFAESATALALSQKRYIDMLEASLIWQKLQPEDSRPYTYTSMAYAHTHQSTAALEHMMTAFSLKGETDFTLLVILLDNDPQKKQQYLESLQQALASSPKNYDVNIATALIHLAQGNKTIAIKYADTALETAAHNPKALDIIIYIYNQNKRFDKAIAAYERGLESNPYNTKLRKSFALYARTHAPDIAKQQFYLLLDAKPKSGFALFHLGTLLFNAKELDEAKPLFQTLLETQQKTNEAHYYLGEIYRLEKQFDSAIAEYEQVSESNLRERSTEKMIAIHIEQSHFEKAQQRLEQAQNSKPTQSHSEELLLLNAMLIEKKGETLKAFDYLSNAIEIHPQSFDLRYSRAMLADELNNMAITESDLRFILKYNPNNAMTLNALGYVLASKTSRLEEAYQLLRKAEQAEPNNPAIMDSLGWLMYKMGKNNESIKYLKSAIEKMPIAEVAAHLGEVLWISGQKDDALKVFKDALQHSPDDNLLNDTLKRLNIDL